MSKIPPRFMAIDLPGEVWLPAVGYEGHIDVSNMGRARWARDGRRGVRKGHLVPPSIDRAGYPVLNVNMPSGMRKRRRHQVIAATFIGPCPTGKQVAHDNGIRTDLRAVNLLYKTPKANTADKYRHGTILYGERSPTAKLTEANVLAIRSSVATCAALAIQYGVRPQAISRIRRGERWPHVPGERIGRPRAKLAAVDVITIRESAESDGRLADHYGVSIVTIQNARSGRTWRGLSERAT